MSQSPQKSDLLFEIGTEELPPKSLTLLKEGLIANLSKALEKHELAFETIQGFVTPRRIAVLISQLDSLQPQRTVFKKGPAQSAGLDASGNPSKALIGFANSCGVNIESLSLQENDKGAWYIFEASEPGGSVFEIIPKLLKDAIETLSLPKRMRWGSFDEAFIRPVHWLVLMYGNTPIPFEWFGIHSSTTTRGHRFHHPNSIPIAKPKDYESLLLKQGKVRAAFDKRREYLLQEIQHRAQDHQAQVDLSDLDLIDEVTGLTEWPVVLVGQFNPEFLKVPKEALISSMKTHQKCFPLENSEKQLLPKFIIISNIESKDPACVIRGNESVVQARLSDAAFHYELDKQHSLESRALGLKKVIFQQKLGTLWDKCQRIKTLASHMMSLTYKHEDTHVERAALLCKADLLTQMVGEFPELQGIMGRYYALNDGETTQVATAIEEHYHPRFANDSLPKSQEGLIIALADRLDSLVGLFGSGKRPTGEKDPFGLRRQMLGMLRIIIEKEFNTLDLSYLFNFARELYGDVLSENPSKELIGFAFERLRAWTLERGVPAKVFEAVVARQPTKPLDFHYRILAVTEFQKLPEAESLSAANKRVQNILTKSEVPIPPEANFNAHHLIEPSEKALALMLSKKEEEIRPMIEQWRYTEALQALASLKDPIDTFFDTVMVMVEDTELRNNRLKLLNGLRALFLKIADISLL